MEQAHALDWATEQFGGAALGDQRRVKRLIRYAAATFIKPSASIPTQCEGKKDFSMAVYRMFSSPKVTFQSVSADPWRQTRESAGQSPATVLMIQETTTLSFDHPMSDGLGPS